MVSLPYIPPLTFPSCGVSQYTFFIYSSNEVDRHAPCHLLSSYHGAHLHFPRQVLILFSLRGDRQTLEAKASI
jgi:hypothetical protein